MKKAPATPIDEKVRFLIDFGSILGPFWEPKSMKNRVKNQSKIDTPKNRPNEASKVLRSPLAGLLPDPGAHWEGGGM